eukprot:GHVH01001807.1.p1 GENE.GHVH01001807.1~~GHVH01001807.1.p1  ORF type:complete len:135 (-),score=16.65 GHVH01001807.1:376-780(-)
MLDKLRILEKKQVDHVQNEKEVLQQLKNNFMVQMVDYAKDDSYLYIYLEFVGGGELFSLLQKRKRLPENDARFYASQIGMFLDYLKSKDVVYRDIKQISDLPSIWRKGKEHTLFAELPSISPQRLSKTKEPIQQ